MLGGDLFLLLNLIIVQHVYTLNRAASTHTKKTNFLLLSSVVFFGKIPTKYFKHVAIVSIRYTIGYVNIS